MRGFFRAPRPDRRRRRGISRSGRACPPTGRGPERRLACSEKTLGDLAGRAAADRGNAGDRQEVLDQRARPLLVSPPAARARRMVVAIAGGRGGGDGLERSPWASPRRMQRSQVAGRSSDSRISRTGRRRRSSPSGLPSPALAAASSDSDRIRRPRPSRSFAAEAEARPAGIRRARPAGNGRPAPDGKSLRFPAAEEAR